MVVYLELWASSLTHNNVLLHTVMCFNRSIHINYGPVLSTNLYGSWPILADFDPRHVIPQDVPRFCRYTSTTYRHNRFSPGSDKSRSVMARFEPETRLGTYMMSSSLWRSLFPKRDQTNQYDSVHANRSHLSRRLRQYYDKAGRFVLNISCFMNIYINTYSRTRYVRFHWVPNYLNQPHWVPNSLFRMRTRLAQLRFCIHVIV